MRWLHEMTLAGVAAIAIIVSSCSGDPAAPAPDTGLSVAVISGDAQVGAVGVQLAEPITVRVTDAHGAPVRGVSVTFQVTGGGGRVRTPSVPTNSVGVASTVWTLGPGPSANTATAGVAGQTESPVTFSAVAVALLEKMAGDTQTAEAAQRAAQDPAVVVRDVTGAPVQGATVRWQVLTGGGRVNPTESVTDASGVASTAWTLGPVVGAGTHSLQASSSLQATATFTASGILTNGTISILAGDGQSGFTDRPVKVPPSVVVKTPGGLPVAGVAVNWAVTTGGGSVSGASGVTNSAGAAWIGWTLGGTVGANAQGLSASATGLPTSPAVSFAATAVALPVSMVKVSGDLQSGTVGTTLPEPLVVLVRDASGAPIAGIAVTWSFDDGWYYGYSWESVTDAAGQASTPYTLSTSAAYPDRVHAEVVGLTGINVSFTATAVAGPAYRIQATSGSGQSAAVGTALPLPIQAIVWDQYWNPVSGVTVNWAAAAGSGSTTVASSVTDRSGVASTGWTVGNSVGTDNQVATATVPGLVDSPVTFTASAVAGP